VYLLDNFVEQAKGAGLPFGLRREREKSDCAKKRTGRGTRLFLVFLTVLFEQHFQKQLPAPNAVTPAKNELIHTFIGRSMSGWSSGKVTELVVFLKERNGMKGAL